MEVSQEIYNWLTEIGLVKDSQLPDENDKYVLPEELTNSLENGLEFTALIKRLNKIQNSLEREITPAPELNSLKQVKSPASKLYNWKVLSTALDLLGVKVDPDSRSLIVAGDRQMVSEVLNQIYLAEVKALKEIQALNDDIISQKSIKLESRPENSKTEKSVQKPLEKTVSRQASTKLIKKKVSPKPLKNADGSLYIDSLDTSKRLEECETCLEYLLVSFCKNFNLRPKQAAGLLTQGGKYLSHVICKGLKSKYDPIIEWYKEIYSTLPYLLQLISKEEVNGSIPLMLTSLNSGFNSKNLDVVLWCCRLFSKLGSDLLELDLLPPAWDWFVSENEGLESTLAACVKFGPFIKSQIVSVYVQFARNNFFELFSIQLRNYIPENIHYFATMNEFLPCLTEIRASKQELVLSGIVEFWIEIGIRESDPENRRPNDVRTASVNFICDIWMAFPAFVEDHEEIGAEILNAIKKGWRDKNKVFRFSCICKAFQLLENFTSERNAYAPIIYKTLTFYLVENYRDLNVRELILENFSRIFTEVQSIPVGILLEPLVKQLQVTNDLHFNMIDFDFFINISKHPRLSMKNALQTMDVIGKIYLNELFFIKAAAIPFMLIATRFIEGTSVQEYLFRFVKYGFLMAYKIESKKKKKIEPEIGENEINELYQRDLMLDMAERIIKIRHEALNDKILKELCSVNDKFNAQFRENSKFVMVLLKLFGNPEELVEAYGKVRKSTEKTVFSSMEKEDLEEEYIKESENPPKPSKIPNQPKKLRISENFNIMQMMPKGRVMLEIEKIRQNAIEKEVEKRLKEEKEKVQAAKRKRVLRNQVEKRRIELGVSSKIDLKSEELKPEGISILREITQEEREIINHVFKRYLRVLKLLFKKYASTGYKRSKIGKETFDSAAEKTSNLSESEFYKLLKEQGITSSIMSLEEFSGILKSYCFKHKKPSILLNFQEYQDILVQVSVFIYSKPSRDLSHLPPALLLKQLFDHFRSASAEKGISTKFYDEPDPGVGDREVVKRLNALLEKDPNTVLPEGFRRVIDSEIDVSYQVPEVLGFEESQKAAIGALDWILCKCLGIHIIEPMIVVKQITRARGILAKPQIGHFGLLNNETHKLNSSGLPNNKASYQPSLPSELTLTTGIKFEVARLTGKYNTEIIMECSKVLDDLIYSVDTGCNTIISRNDKKKIVNKVIIQKEQEIISKKNVDQIKEKRRRFRKQIIEEKLKKAKLDKEIKAKEETEKKKKDEEIEKEKKKKEEEQRKELYKKRGKELKEWKVKKMEEEAKAKEEEEKKNKRKEEIRKKKRENFLKNVKLNIRNKSISKHESKVYEEKKAEDDKKKSAELKASKKKIFEKKLEKEKRKKDENENLHKEFTKVKSDPKTREVFESMKKSVELVYDHYCKSTTNKDGVIPTILPFAGFNKFCVSFNIIPGLFTNDKCIMIFRQSKSKQSQAGPTNALSQEEFEEVLLRISLTCKEELQKDLFVQFTNEQECLKGLFEYLSITADSKVTRELLRNIDLLNKNKHPRDKKRMKNQLNKSISRELSSSNKNIRKALKRIASESKNNLLPESLSQKKND